MNDMVEVVIDSVRVSLMSPQRVVVLRQKDVERYLPIWIGPYEAESITVALQEVEISRPLTHDLMKNLFAEFGSQILRVEIISMKQDIFFGNIVAEKEGKPLNIDARPSDAIALAVRAHVPMFVSQAVMDAAGIVPERPITEEPPAELETQGEEKTAPEDDNRLDVYEDFLKKLDSGREGKEKPKA